MRGFRVWDIGRECYLDETELAGITPDGKHILYIEEDEISQLEIEGDYIVEFDTGLKDENGKEIYEGDIVEALIDGVWSTGRNTVSFGKAKWKLEVVYNDIRYMDIFRVIGSKNNPDRIYYFFEKELSELEVIGNIHENGELLEGKK